MLNKITASNKKGSVIYWMSRDQRINNNWALLFSQHLAEKDNSNIQIVFNLVPEFLDATFRQYHFMIEGLKECEKQANELNIPFTLLIGDPVENITRFINSNNVSQLITDFDPLTIKKQWKQYIISKLTIPFWEVDAHNIVPVWVTSVKQEFGAYTIRPKINRLLKEYLVDFPEIRPQNLTVDNNINWDEVYKNLTVNNSVKPVKWIKPGRQEAEKTLQTFINNKIDEYGQRNDPNKNKLSNLSPYLHFGQICSQEIAVQILKSNISQENSSSFLEELIVRKELSDNFCYYNSNYDNLKGAPKWALETLDNHRNDEREYVYSREQFEHAKTHDELWNAAQIEMVSTGKMHGYMRMYWAKKILEWSSDPEDALSNCIYLNDKYELDGRDPNGYAGCLWSVAGLHDRAWAERPVFGKIRYMNYNGCKRKFNVQEYIERNNREYLKHSLF